MKTHHDALLEKKQKHLIETDVWSLPVARQQLFFLLLASHHAHSEQKERPITFHETESEKRFRFFQTNTLSLFFLGVGISNRKSLLGSVDCPLHRSRLSSLRSYHEG